VADSINILYYIVLLRGITGLYHMQSMA